jgi:hypothetical protein
MSFIMGRDGNISVIRVGTIAAILGILFIVGAIVWFYVDRAAHQSPLEIEPFPNAQQRGITPRSNTARSVIYYAEGTTPEDVAAFYQQKLNNFYGNTDEACVRSPSQGNFPQFEQGDPNVPPYQYSCLFDNSGFQITRYTRVNIQPGIKSLDTEGIVVIQYEQYWQQ